MDREFKPQSYFVNLIPRDAGRAAHQVLTATFGRVKIMKLNAQHFRDVLANLGPKPAVFVTPPDHYRDWLKEKRLPTLLVDFLLENALEDFVVFPNGCGSIWAPDTIMAQNEYMSEVLACGLFPIGSAINGDFIVLDLTEGTDQAGFVCHAEFFGQYWKKPGVDVREIFVPVDSSLHELLAGMSAELHECMAGKKCEQPDDYPIDYYSALERQGNA